MLDIALDAYRYELDSIYYDIGKRLKLTPLSNVSIEGLPLVPLTSLRFVPLLESRVPQHKG